MDKSRIYPLVLYGILLIVCASCRQVEIEGEEQLTGVDHSVLPDWTDKTHGHNTDPDYQVVFDHEEVIRFDIHMDAEDWSDMQSDLVSNLGSSGGRPDLGGMGSSSDYTPIWVPCSFIFKGTEWYHVGIRFKGNSSLRSAYRSGIKKLSFKLDFDEFEGDYPEIKDQRFFGFRQLNLKNNFDDASLMREKVASDLFEDFGLASSRTAFCVVYVDYGQGPVYFGVYTLVEEVDDTVLDKQFGSSVGNLYKPDGSSASFAASTFNESQMVKRNNEEVADYSDVYELFTAINSPVRTSDPDTWKSRVTDCFDVDIFLQWLASNTAMQNWDTYGIMTHNYYLYNNPASRRLTWIPWDNNEALQEGKMGGALGLSMDEVGSNWPLIRYLMDCGEFENRYQQYLSEFMDGVFAPAQMIERYTRYKELLSEHAYAEESPRSFIRSDASFDAAVEELKEHVQERYQAIASYLNN